MPLRYLTPRERAALSERPDEAARLIATGQIRCDRCSSAAQTTCHAEGVTDAVCFSCSPAFARGKAAETRIAVRRMLAGALAMLALTIACSPMPPGIEPRPAGGDVITVLIRNSTPHRMTIYASNSRARLGSVEALSQACIRVPATGSGVELWARPQASSMKISAGVLHFSRIAAASWTIQTARTSPLNVLVPANPCGSELPQDRAKDHFDLLHGRSRIPDAAHV
ncbi:MAG TPA: hypothetical protein VF167_03580 [Longimicrobiaceae bacterium]